MTNWRPSSSSRSALLDREAIRRERARRHLEHFTTYTYAGYRVNWHHRVVCQHLDRFVAGEIRRLMLFMPPQHGKSELVSRRLPAYIFGRNPDARIVAASYSADLASRMNRDTQRIIDSDAYRELFPGTTLYGKNVRSVATGSYLRNSDIFEIVGHRGSYRGAGIGGGITGMPMTFGIIDDPFKDRAEADSIATRKGVWEWYTSTFSTRMAPRAGVLITLTRWHEDDLAGRLLKLAAEDPRADKWTVVTFPAIAEPDKHPDDPREVGDLIWPGQYDQAFYDARRAASERDFAALYQQRPAPVEGGMLKRGWWRFYRELPAEFDELIQSWDMTFKDTKSSDFVVGQIWGRRGAHKYLIDQVRARMDYPTTKRAVRTLAAKWPQARRIYIEGAANGPAIIADLRDEIAGLIEVDPEGSKVSRVYAVSGDIEAGNVSLPDPAIAPWIHEFIEECAAFPNGTHDDQVDTTSQALLKLRQAVTNQVRARVL